MLSRKCRWTLLSLWDNSVFTANFIALIYVLYTWHNNDVTKHHFQVTIGAIQAIFWTFQCFVEQDDEIIVFDPSFDAYVASSYVTNSKIVPVSLLVEVSSQCIRMNTWITNPIDSESDLLEEPTKQLGALKVLFFATYRMEVGFWTERRLRTASQPAPRCSY